MKHHFLTILNGKSKFKKLVPINEEDVALEYAKTWRIFLEHYYSSSLSYQNFFKPKLQQIFGMSYFKN
jgi:hypothetical protein